MPDSEDTLAVVWFFSFFVDLVLLIIVGVLFLIAFAKGFLP